MIARLTEIQADSVDAVVTDPPYHLTTGKKGGSGAASVNLDSPYGRARVGTGFMGMKWDGGDVAMRTETWAAALRVAKPGAHLVAFGGTRAFHRMWCAIEDAGWELRDTLMWLYGTGFPKSSNQDGDWEGWGTALKPAYEPILLARKPLAGNTAENLAAHRVGALNIDASRVDVVDRAAYDANHSGDRGHAGTRDHEQRGATDFKPGGGSASDLGRWPANVLHDGSEEVVSAFPQSTTAAPVRRRGADGDRTTFGAFSGQAEANSRGASTGSAARFFWCPKASRKDRNEGLEGMEKKPLNWSSGDESQGTFQSEGTERAVENFHPTVKPTELMRYLIRLVTPAGGIVLDPFMGSGSTGKAAAIDGYGFVGVELDEQYIEIARRRIAAARGPLFS
jgi:site-specific DNA-methyltransferase (adenine-specific)